MRSSKCLRLCSALFMLWFMAIATHAEEPVGSGTAFFVNSDGWAVTNAHVIRDCSRITTGDGSRISEVKLDVGNDLAAIRINAKSTTVIAIRPSGARLGEDIAAFGYPLASVLSSSVKITTGNVNSLMGLGDDTRYLQISTPIQPGNSGGPIVDRKGALLGVTTATLRPEAGGGALPQNVNFAIRATLLQTFLESRSIEFEVASTASVELTTADLAERLQPAILQIVCYGGGTGQKGSESTTSTTVPLPEPYRASRKFSTLDGHDVVGFDYATLRNVGLQQCKQACVDDSRCSAITYNKRERFCFLKDDAKLLVQNADAYAMVVDELSAEMKLSTFVIGSGKDIPGSDYRRLKTDFITCYLECEIDNLCRAFSYVRKKRECWLKNRVGPVSLKHGVDSGIK
ncbi:PAN domain-containing protein [Mesorhizobium australicum]|uniref:PAN domain-containing protein n=2 Tax=Mesorhizobium australicum TaxID=536018 RepID=A0A1X7PA47_9HYPH|nr:PAN domain-containing protein [Mesorhizobium australicum]